MKVLRLIPLVLLLAACAAPGGQAGCNPASSSADPYANLRPGATAIATPTPCPTDQPAPTVVPIPAASGAVVQNVTVTVQTSSVWDLMLATAGVCALFGLTLGAINLTAYLRSRRNRV